MNSAGWPVGTARRTPAATARRVESPAGLAPWLHLAAFAGLAGFGAAYWASFVSAAPAGRIVGVLAVACCLGAVLILIGRASLPRPAIHGAALVATLAALGFALVAAGLDAGLLKPARWDGFAGVLDRGFDGLRRVSWPYDGLDAFVRLTILLAIPVVLVLAAALAFWPVRSKPGFDSVALVLLIAFYTVAIADQDFGGEIGRGLLLLVLIAAWIWLPHMGRRAAPAGALALVAAALFAMPVAAVLDSDRGWVDYSEWGIGGEERTGATFDWNHRYGSIDWPRNGRTLLAVKSDQPHYWKAETLDFFDGLRWAHSSAGERRPLGAELPDDLNPAWEKRITFTVRELRSDLLIGAGTFFDSEGDTGVSVVSGDGTVRLIEEPLREGDSYSVRAYVPDPSAERMRQAADGWDESLRRYVSFALPRPGQNALDVEPGELRRQHAAASDRVALPFRGEATDSYARRTVRAIRESPYARMYALSRKLAKGKTTTYDVVRTTERWLQDNLRYSERVPSRPYPLSDFIFKDKVGYCQQFSGSMALMLRMNGIPARVAGGFAPGIYDQATREFRVRDLDAHSWVEVYFDGIGWVPFDPTPTAAPAGSQSNVSDGASAARGGQDRSSNVQAERTESRAGSGGPDSLAGDDGSSTRLWMLPIVVLVLLALALGGLWLYSVLHERRHRRFSPEDAQLAELRSALERMGHDLPPQTTLSALERRLRTLVGPAAARYAAGLRAGRYAPPGAGTPDQTDRAALRRELARSAGRLGRVRAYLALPPRPPA